MMEEKNNKILPLESVSVKLSKQDITALNKLASLTGESRSYIIRGFVREGLKINSYKQEKDFLAKLIDETLTDILNRYMERIATLTAKGTLSSVTALYINAEVLEKYVPEEDRRSYEETIKEARARAAEYVKGRKGNE